MADRRAIICLSGQRCGVLEETSNGGSRFTYDDSWLEHRDARPVSLTMPLRSEPYEEQNLLTYFRNLLPEGWLLDISLPRLKIARDDGFGLLLATCCDCIGEVEVVPPKEGE